MPDPRAAGLDPAHILGICNGATGGRSSLAVRAREGICVCLPSRRSARSAQTALTRVGYQVMTPAGGRRNLIVNGWSQAGLEGRLDAMRNIVHQLAEDPSLTATTAVRRFRNLPPGSMAPHPLAVQILDEERMILRDWVSARAGIHASHDPAIHPFDLGLALRLRATWVLEQTIDDLTERHLGMAGHALALFHYLSERMPADRAQRTAIRWAGITFHLSSSAAQNPSLLTPGGPGVLDRRYRPSAQPASGPVSGASPGTVLEFPGPIEPEIAAPDTTPGPPVPPSKGHIPPPTRAPRR